MKRPRKRKTPLTLHSFLTEVKVKAIEIAITIVFLDWLCREVFHAIAR
jgi:hypothetical protein